MFSNIDLRTRQVLLIVVLAVAAAGAGLLTLQRLHKSGSSSTPEAVAPVTKTPAHQRTAPHATRAPHRAVKPKPVPQAVQPADRLPAPIRQAFAADRVVVVGLYDPRAKIDGSAIAEARAGARLADSSFVPIDVRTNSVTSLNAKYGVIQDPAVLVLRPSGELVVRIDGFADRDTVAQAAANAAS